MNIIRDGLFILIYLAGVVSVVKWRKKQPDPSLFFYWCIWSFLTLLTYIIVLEMGHGTFFFLIPLCLFVLFLLSYFADKRRIVNGFIFNIFIVVFGGYLGVLMLQTGNVLLLFLLIIVGIPILIGLIFGVYALIAFLLGNAYIVWKRETRSLANLLTLVLGLAIIVFLFIETFVLQFLPDWANTLFGALPACIIYFILVFCNFMTVSILYQFNHPKFNQDYIVVLGAGLIDGQTVSPLLAKRIDKAIAFYQAQLKQTGHPIKLVMSGGQGSDEKVPEAVAMKVYAVSKGIPEADIVLEANSTSTYENMKFSKECMEKLSPNGYRSIFSSNNYHIFRAGMFARQAQLSADGIGAKTALYYLPNAFLREFIAIVMMHKKRHLIICLLIIFMAIFLTFITIINK